MEIEEIRKLAESEKKGIINLDTNNTQEQVSQALQESAKESGDVKGLIDLLATQTALKQEETLQKVVDEKSEELKNDASSKRVRAEAKLTNEEANKIEAIKKKEIAELDRQISIKEKEVEQLKADSDKALAYFEQNKDILKCINVTSKKSLGTMKILMIPAIVVFVIVQILASPITICGALLEAVIGVIGGVCGAVKNSAIKIIVTILVVALLIGAYFGVAYFVPQLFAKADVPVPEI